MYSRSLIGFLHLHIFVAAMLFGTAAFAAELTSRSSESGGVTIAVKPVDVSAAAANWSFQVSLRSQSQDLRDDLVRTAFIVDRAGKKRESPIGWEGDSAGGRQRKGVLRFKALAPLPTAIELRIQRAGEKAPRTFRWDLSCPCEDATMHPS